MVPLFAKVTLLLAIAGFLQWAHVEELLFASSNDVEPEEKRHVLGRGIFSVSALLPLSKPSLGTLEYKVRSFTDAFPLATCVYIRRVVTEEETNRIQKKGVRISYGRFHPTSEVTTSKAKRLFSDGRQRTLSHRYFLSVVRWNFMQFHIKRVAREHSKGVERLARKFGGYVNDDDHGQKFGTVRRWGFIYLGSTSNT
jgi:hypothetical protein